MAGGRLSVSWFQGVRECLYQGGPWDFLLPGGEEWGGAGDQAEGPECREVEWGNDVIWKRSSALG